MNGPDFEVIEGLPVDRKELLSRTYQIRLTETQRNQVSDIQDLMRKEHGIDLAVVLRRFLWVLRIKRDRRRALQLLGLKKPHKETIFSMKQYFKGSWQWWR